MVRGRAIGRIGPVDVWARKIAGKTVSTPHGIAFVSPLTSTPCCVSVEPAIRSIEIGMGEAYLCRTDSRPASTPAIPFLNLKQKPNRSRPRWGDWCNPFSSEPPPGSKLRAVAVTDDGRNVDGAWVGGCAPNIGAGRSEPSSCGNNARPGRLPRRFQRVSRPSGRAGSPVFETPPDRRFSPGLSPAMRNAAMGYILYSVGPNGVDDGGIPAMWMTRRTIS